MIKPRYDKVIELMKKMEYRIYDTDDIEWNLNIVGIRSKSRSGKKFDDTLMVFHKFMGKWYSRYYPITTEPSEKYLLKPINPKGTAILKPDQYRNAYKIDIHRRGKPGGHKALCQRLGDVVVYRDNNMNGKLNLVGSDTGRFGINIHKGPLNGDYDSENDIYSAGCQVFADSRHFELFMQVLEFGRKAFGNKFTYTLIREEDL